MFSSIHMVCIFHSFHIRFEYSAISNLISDQWVTFCSYIMFHLWEEKPSLINFLDFLVLENTFNLNFNFCSTFGQIVKVLFLHSKIFFFIHSVIEKMIKDCLIISSIYWNYNISLHYRQFRPILMISLENSCENFPLGPDHVDYEDKN